MTHTRLSRLSLAGLCATVVALASVPAIGADIHVTTTLAKVGGKDTGGCSLQEAIYSANFDANVAIDSTNPDHFVTTDCEPGDGFDAIILPENANFEMNAVVDDAYNFMGPTATPMVFSHIQIFANGSRIERVGGANLRAFAVGRAMVDLHPAGIDRFATGTGDLAIVGADIKGFRVKGGDGRSGGGGGLGAGGAIFVTAGTLFLQDCTFEGNAAVGGDGSHSAGTRGGGGGGLSGNGGYAGIPKDSVWAGGGGGGGARGDGGDGEHFAAPEGRGGAGGGTVTAGGQGTFTGFACGGAGGHSSFFLDGDDGDDAGCNGGGGGGGQSRGDTSYSFLGGNGGAGLYGGGGGGGGYDLTDGGPGGFGGGGGAATTGGSNFDGNGPTGGDGGFGGGGGAGDGGYLFHNIGHGGTFLAGNGGHTDGGGGAALGGAIFSNGGTISVYDCTFVGNAVQHGYTNGDGHWGSDAGGAIFSRNGSLAVYNSTVSGNSSTATDAGVIAFGDEDTASFELRNTIIFGNGTHECRFYGDVNYNGSGNLIGDDFGCTGLATQVDPQLGPLQQNAPGHMPTMAIDSASSAYNAGDDAYCTTTDERGVLRAPMAPCDIGAYEVGCSVMHCPADVTEANDPAQCGAAVSYPAPTTDGSCTPVCTPAAGSFFDVGTTSVSCTAESLSCSFSVTVNDTEKPTVTAPAGVVASNDPGKCSATVNPGLGSASDNCPGVTVSGTRSDGQALGAPYPVGTTSISWTATDAHGNASATSATETVKVNDTEPPSLSDPGASPASLWPPNHKMREDTISYAETDNCPGSVCALSVASSEPINGLGDGDTSPDWIVEDDHHEQLRAERSGLGDGRTYTTTVTCADVAGNKTAKTVAVRVSHDMDGPAAGSMFAAGAPVAFSGHYLDTPGVAHRGSWSFDAIGTVATVAPPSGTRPGAVNGSFAFAAPGVYSVKMNVTDANGQTGTSSMVGGFDAAIVIYPAGGNYVSGGGWIVSPAGAYTADPTLGGKASFGFVSKSARTAASTGGETEFDLHLPGFKFNAINFESQTVTGGKAQLRGTGTVNGSGAYKFLMSVIDGQADTGGPDKFRIKIWNKSTGSVVYDNEMGTPESADPVTPVGTGSSIVLHR